MTQTARPLTAPKAYRTERNEVLNLLHRLTVTMNSDAVRDCDAANWSNVGTMAEARRQLQALSDFIHGEGEHAL